MAIPTSTTIYGKVLPNQSKNIVSNHILKTTGFKYPITSSPSRGYFSKQSGLDLIKNNLRILLRTVRGERFMLPNYGCNLQHYLMEPLDQTTFNLVKTDIQESIRKYIRGVNILKLRIGGSPTSVMSVQLFCALKDSDLVRFDTRIEI